MDKVKVKETSKEYEVSKEDLSNSEIIKQRNVPGLRVGKSGLEKNFENVGDNFTYKARSLHYDGKDDQKGIFGTASLKDIKELNEEGIETATLDASTPF